MTKAEFFTLFSSFTPQEKLVLLEEVAPYKKAERLKEQLSACLSDMNAGVARVKAHINDLTNRVANGEEVAIPTFDELTTIFRGA